MHKGYICIEVVSLSYLHLVAASRSYRLVPKMVLTLQLALVVFFPPSLVHLLMCTQTNMHKLQLALCGGGGGGGGGDDYMWWWLCVVVA